MLAQRPIAEFGPPVVAHWVGGGRRSQPAQNKSNVLPAGGVTNSKIVQSERVPAGSKPLNGSFVAAKKRRPAEVVAGLGSAAPLAAEPGVRQVGDSYFQKTTTDCAIESLVMPQCRAVANSMRLSLLVLFTNDPVQKSTPPCVYAPTERRGLFHTSSGARQATSILHEPDLHKWVLSPKPR